MKMEFNVKETNPKYVQDMYTIWSSASDLNLINRYDGLKEQIDDMERKLSLYRDDMKAIVRVLYDRKLVPFKKRKCSKCGLVNESPYPFDYSCFACGQPLPDSIDDRFVQGKAV